MNGRPVNPALPETVPLAVLAQACEPGQPPPASPTQDSLHPLVAALQSTLGRMDLAFAAMDEAVAWTDAAGRIQWCNRSFTRLASQKLFHLLGQDITRMLPVANGGAAVRPEDHPVVRALAGRAGERSRGHYEIERSGSKRHVEIQCTRFGNVEQLLVLIRDMTERVWAESWLERSGARTELLRSAASAANESISPVDATRRILELLCRHTAWPVGSAFFAEPQSDGGVRLTGTPRGWCADSSRFGLFRMASEQAIFHGGEGIPGRVYQTRAPLWCHQVCEDSRFAASGAAYGAIRTVFAFPVFQGREVGAVIEIASADEIEEDPDLNELAEEIATHLGHAFERHRAAAELRRANEDLERRVAARTADLSALNTSLMREVADRQQVEANLRETTTRHRDLVQSVRDVMFSVGRSGRIESLNPAFEKLTGFRSSEWVARRVLQLVHPEDRRTLALQFRSALAGGATAPIEARVRTKRGKWVTLELTMAPRRVHGGSSGVLGVARDITERVETEHRLRLHERAIDSASDGIFLIDAIDPEQPVIYANSGLERITGYARSAIAGRSWMQLLGTEREAVSRTLENALDPNVANTVEIETARADGSHYWCRIALTPVLDAAGCVTHFVGILTDISQQKEADRLKNELVATVSHELRTPLTSLRGFAELMLQREYPPEKQKRFLGIINKEATRLANLINDFLDIQRIESGRQTYNFDSMPIRAVFHETAALFKGSSQIHTFTVDAPEDLVVVADGERIRQVFANLVSNAVKFSPAGGPVRLRLVREDGHARCSVIDSGLGISEENLARLFQKFSRIDNSDTRKIGGTGLGLALVKQIVEAHRGTIAVESAPGKGSTFSFTIPLA
ncbi:MAG: PAS domain S-box protein [Bryobacteraceae bacterium]